ncbi:MAG: DUF5683 domain-containing protein [Ignavibacteriales bacterium]|nr:DUF5683 domain-containing protein [Ignavibacteriales bacterium]
MDNRLVYRNCIRSMMACALVVMLSVFVNAQYKVSSALFKPASTQAESVFAAGEDTVRTDSTNALRATGNLKSPGTAVLLSAILPGAGQVYTGRYWKVPIVLGFSGYFVYEVIKQNNSYKSAQGQYTASVNNGENNGQGNAQLQYERDFYRDERDRFGFYFLLTYLLNMVDAYVDASLFGFDVGDNLTGGTSLKIRIPIR